jgi:hypothetical protein
MQAAAYAAKIVGSWWLLQFRSQLVIAGMNESSSDLEQAAVT